MMVDLFASVNVYGKRGAGVPADMVNEWCVKSVKKIEARYSSNYEVIFFKPQQK